MARKKRFIHVCLAAFCFQVTVALRKNERILDADLGTAHGAKLLKEKGRDMQEEETRQPRQLVNDPASFLSTDSAAKMQPCKSKLCQRNVVIIGGGPVGLFTGLELALQQYEVTLLENEVYEGLWKENDHFTRSQILLLQDYAGSSRYLSLKRLFELLPSDLWEELLSRSCAFTPPPIRGTMTCAPIDAEWRENFEQNGGKLSLSIRELQFILYKALVRAGGVVHFTKYWLSFVDHRGHVFYSTNYTAVRGVEYEMDMLGLYSDWHRCGAKSKDGSIASTMNNVQFARCWKMVKHPDHGEEMSSHAEHPRRNGAVSQRVINMIHGNSHPSNCKGDAMFQAAGKCRIDQATWLNIMHATELKPDILICADGKNGDCRNIVGLGKSMQKNFGLSPLPHKKNNNGYALLFQVSGEEIPELMAKGSNGSLEHLMFRDGTELPENERMDVQNWPRPQHRFRAFPSRYYDGSQEDFYFAAAVTKQEFDDYTRMCKIAGKDACEGYFGYWPQGEDKQIGLETDRVCGHLGEVRHSNSSSDLSADEVEDLTNECLALHPKFLGILSSILAWTNVPGRHWDDIARGARMSGFRIFFLRADRFAMHVTDSEDRLAFAVGDAAMDVHFFSGTGVNMGFKTGRILADLLGQWIGSPGFAGNGDDPSLGEFAESVHQESLSFANDVPVANEEAEAAKEKFRRYVGDSGYARSKWLVHDEVVQEYHELLDLLMVHKHMDASYDVLHASTYDYPDCDTVDQRNTCFVCRAATCPANDFACLDPFNEDIPLTQNQRRIKNWITNKSSDAVGLADRGTLCALHETYKYRDPL